MLVLAPAASGPIKSKDTAISTAEQAVGGVHVTRSDAKAMTWSDWQQRSGNRGGPVPAPSSGTKVWVVALHGQFTKLGRGAPAAVIVLDATTWEDDSRGDRRLGLAPILGCALALAFENAELVTGSHSPRSLSCDWRPVSRASSNKRTGSNRRGKDMTQEHGTRLAGRNETSWRAD